MDVKDAVVAAKTYVQRLYGDSEHVTDVSLEEVEFDLPSRRWLVTVEFSRPVKSGFRTLARELLEKASGDEFIPRRRVQKVVIVSDSEGLAVAMKNREAA